MVQIAKFMIIFGIILLISGAILLGVTKITNLGKLPGDITIKGRNFTLYIPVVSMVIVSLVLTIIFNLFNRR